jgi:hypothetical protein
MANIKFSTPTALALAAVLLSSSTTVFAVSKIPKHSVGAKQLKTSAVTNPKIAKRAVTSSKVKPNSLGGTAINESTLGQVPSAANAGTAGNAARLEGQGAAAFVGAARMAFGKGNASSTAVATVLSLPSVGVTVTTDGDTDTDPEVIVNLPSTAPAFSWVVNASGESQTFSTMGGPLTLGTPVPVTTTSSRELTAHIWRSDTSAGMFLHCVFDTDNFTSARPLSCWALST